MATRCVACNANRTYELKTGEKNGTPIRGRKCSVCGAQWKIGGNDDDVQSLSSM